MGVMRRSIGGKRERGAALVEAAVVLPILLLVVIAILELGLAFKDYLTVSYLSREGTRIGALAGDDQHADCAILRGIGELATPKDLERVDEVQIFRANQSTGAQIPGNTNVASYVVGRDPTICSVPANPTIDGWSFSTVTWPPTSRQTVVGSTPLDIIGVRVILTRNWITGFGPFRGDSTIDESTITRLEPEVFE